MVATVTYALESVKANFQANTYTTLNQLAPDVLGLSNGGYVVAYTNFQVSQGVIFLDFYDASGVSLGGYQTPYDSNSSAAGAPTLTQMADGNVVVIWDDNDPLDLGLKGAIFTPGGVRVGGEFEVTSTAAETVPQVAALTGGGFVVAFQSGSAIILEVFDQGANPISPEIEVATAVGGNSEPVVTGLADGGFVVTWPHDNGTSLELRARIFEADGSVREVNGSTDDFVVAQGGDNSQPAISALPNGNWAIAYTDSGWGDEEVGISLTIMGPNGEVVNAIEHVNLPGDPENESDADIAVLDNGFIVVSWTNPFNPGVDEDIYCRVFDQNGNPITVNGSDVIALDSSLANEVKSAVSGILGGRFLAGWQDSDTDGNGGQVTAAVKELVRTTAGDGTSESLNGDDIRDVINGNGGADTLNGFGGDDRLDGGAGADVMGGGSGNDTYVVDNAGDVVTEAFGDGVLDRVMARASYALAAGADIELLTTVSSGATTAINLTGNALHQDITGNAGRNTLKDGGGTGDMLRGLGGNDIYLVYAAATKVVEGSTGGADRVLAAVDFTLGSGQYVEALGTTNASGTSAIDLTGNALHQTITGNAGANVLSDGGAGKADTMIGLSGNDTYRVYNAGDVVQETASQGTADRVMAAVDYKLGAGVHVESLTTNGSTGKSGIDLTGNAFVQEILGNAGDNRLEGREGSDTLRGFGGDDSFVFNTKLGATNVDTLLDFNVADDRFLLSDAIFTELNTGVLLSGYFRANTTGVAPDSNDHIIYETDTGKLFYDADGLGGSAGIQFAKLAVGLALTYADFSVA